MNNIPSKLIVYSTPPSPPNLTSKLASNYCLHNDKLCYRTQWFFTSECGWWVGEAWSRLFRHRPSFLLARAVFLLEAKFHFSITHFSVKSLHGMLPLVTVSRAVMRSKISFFENGFSRKRNRVENDPDMARSVIPWHSYRHKFRNGSMKTSRFGNVLNVSIVFAPDQQRARRLN